MTEATTMDTETMPTLSHEEFLQLEGLLALSRKYRDWLDHAQRQIANLIQAREYSGPVMDFYAGDAEELVRRHGVYVEPYVSPGDKAEKQRQAEENYRRAVGGDLPGDLD